MRPIERVVLVHRLREVTWLPAVEHKGEGVFLQFHRDAIDQWLGRPEVFQRGRKLNWGFDCWTTPLAERTGIRNFCRSPGLDNGVFPQEYGVFR